MTEGDQVFVEEEEASMWDAAPVPFQPKRLLKLADLLEEDADNPNGMKFNMGVWGKTKVDGKLGVDCGTQGCAMGLAALSGIFKRQGLRYRYEQTYDPTTPWNHDAKEILEMAIFHVDHPEDDELIAAAYLFGITMQDADYLFTPDGKNPTTGKKAERRTAQKIREFVAGKLDAKRT
jgi:hypothetical protein